MQRVTVSPCSHHIAPERAEMDMHISGPAAECDSHCFVSCLALVSLRMLKATEVREAHQGEPPAKCAAMRAARTPRQLEPADEDAQCTPAGTHTCPCPSGALARARCACLKAFAPRILGRPREVVPPVATHQDPAGSAGAAPAEHSVIEHWRYMAVSLRLQMCPKG